MTAESLRIRGGGASTMPVWAFRNGTLLTPPSRRHTISASAFLHRHNSSPSSSSMCAFFVSLCISSFTPSVFPAAPRHNLRWRNLSGEGFYSQMFYYRPEKRRGLETRLEEK